MFAASGFALVYLLVLLAGVVILFWLAITAIRALNVYIANNKAAPTVLETQATQRNEDDPTDMI